MSKLTERVRRRLDSRDYIYSDRGKTLPDLLRLCDEVEALEQVLGNLCDLQNGPPLPSYTEDYNKAMKAAWEILEGKVVG